MRVSAVSRGGSGLRRAPGALGPAALGLAAGSARPVAGLGARPVAALRAVSGAVAGAGGGRGRLRRLRAAGAVRALAGLVVLRRLAGGPVLVEVDPPLAGL